MKVADKFEGSLFSVLMNLVVPDFRMNLSQYGFDPLNILSLELTQLLAAVLIVVPFKPLIFLLLEGTEKHSYHLVGLLVFTLYA